MFPILKFFGKKQEFTNIGIGELTVETTTVNLDDTTESLGKETKLNTKKSSFRRSLNITNILQAKSKNAQPPANQPTPSTAKPRTTTRAASVDFKLDQYTASTAFLNRLLEYYDEKNRSSPNYDNFHLIKDLNIETFDAFVRIIHAKLPARTILINEDASTEEPKNNSELPSTQLTSFGSLSRAKSQIEEANRRFFEMITETIIQLVKHLSPTFFNCKGSDCITDSLDDFILPQAVLHDIFKTITLGIKCELKLNQKQTKTQSAATLLLISESIVNYLNQFSLSPIKIAAIMQQSPIAKDPNHFIIDTKPGTLFATTNQASQDSTPLITLN